MNEVIPILQRAGLTAGFVERASSSLGGEPRASEHVRLAERVQALLLDPACEALVVACTPEEIAEEGLPLDRCNLCVIEPQVKSWEPLRGLLEQCSDRIIESAPTETALTGWLKDQSDGPPGTPAANAPTTTFNGLAASGADVQHLGAVSKAGR